jgi:hypothetical protein
LRRKKKKLAHFFATCPTLSLAYFHRHRISQPREKKERNNQPIEKYEKKERNNQAIETYDQKCLECGMLKS